MSDRETMSRFRKANETLCRSTKIRRDVVALSPKGAPPTTQLDLNRAADAMHEV
jgi:hypothetical protein